VFANIVTVVVLLVAVVMMHVVLLVSKVLIYLTKANVSLSVQMEVMKMMKPMNVTHVTVPVELVKMMTNVVVILVLLKVIYTYLKIVVSNYHVHQGHMLIKMKELVNHVTRPVVLVLVLNLINVILVVEI
jgi:hypothetical protein